MSFAKNIGYHTRLVSDNKVKVCGGSFGGALDIETANRLVSAQFTVIVKHSGRAVFVDRAGREVSLYISVDPEATDKGKEAVTQGRVERRKRQAENEQREAKHQEQVEQLMSGLTNEEIIRRLGVPDCAQADSVTEYYQDRNRYSDVKSDGGMDPRNKDSK
jgi:hypothetical protein